MIKHEMEMKKKEPLVSEKYKVQRLVDLVNPAHNFSHLLSFCQVKTFPQSKWKIFSGRYFSYSPTTKVYTYEK